MKLKKMKRPVLILLTLLTVFALAAAQAEVTAVDTEANGKVTQTVANGIYIHHASTRHQFMGHGGQFTRGQQER